MTIFIIAVICIAVALTALLLQKTYFYVPLKELKRQATGGDELARVLYRAAAYGDSLKVLLWLVLGLAAAVGIELFARVAPPMLGFLVVVLTLWIAFIWMPNTRVTGPGIRLVVWVTPVVVWLASSLNPFLRWVAGFVSRHMLLPHSQLYERADIIDLIEQQKLQRDNRISEHELALMRQVLQFGDYRVRDVVTPRKKVKAIALDESIGPVLLDELHASNHARFPVYDGKPKDIVGTLHLRDIVDVKQGGRVRDHYDKHVYYVHEADSLLRALQAFYQTKQQLFVVINSFDEYVGIVTIEDLLRQLLTHAVEPLPGAHDDRKAVAARHDKPAAKPVEAPTADEPLSEDTSEVVE